MRMHCKGAAHSAEVGLSHVNPLVESLKKSQCSLTVFLHANIGVRDKPPSKWNNRGQTVSTVKETRDCRRSHHQLLLCQRADVLHQQLQQVRQTLALKAATAKAHERGSGAVRGIGSQQSPQAILFVFYCTEGMYVAPSSSRQSILELGKGHQKKRKTVRLNGRP